MTTTTTDTSGFVQSMFIVQLNTAAGANGDFPSYAQVMGYNVLNDDPGETNGQGAVGAPGAPALTQQMKQILNDVGDGWNALPQYFSKGKCRDTSIGGNDAINCYPQFCENDDISEHPFLSINPADPKAGMGRVYSEVYDDQQQIMYLTFGVPQFNSLSNFYGNAVVGTLAKLMNNGDWAGDVGYLTGTALGTFVMIPVLPLVFIYKVLGGLSNANITKYYDFKSAMPLYYRCVNSMIHHLTINMGLEKDSVLIPPGSSQTSGGSTSSLTPQQQYAQATQTEGGTPTVGLPEIFEKGGPDIYQILLKKYYYMTQTPPVSNTSDYTLITNTPDTAIDDLVDPNAAPTTYAQQFFTQFVGQLYDATLYIGFRIEKGVDTSESFTSETGESEIAQQINSQSQAAREAKFKFAGGTGIGVLDSFVNGVKGMLSGAANATGLAAVNTILAGNGLVDFPDVWKSSSTSKSYTFNMSLRSPYGDPVSVLQNLYIPLCLLLGGSLPRAIGQAAYTSPFICRAYCKGMFAVPLGMITHITVKRGADQFGWNTQRLPTCIDVSFEIKDLSPAMYLAIGDGGTIDAIKQVFGANSTFQEYLMTLSGMGLADRIIWIKQLRTKATYLLAQWRSTKQSPAYWGATLGNTVPAKMLSVFVPVTKIAIPNN